MDRVRHFAAAGLVAACASMQACTPAPSLPPLVCSDAGVLQQVREAIRARGRIEVLEAASVGEVSTDPAMASPPLAHCVVRGHTVAHDTNRYGASPVHVPFTVNYTVELRHRGLFVSVD